MILLNGDDMSILVSKQFMSMEEYLEIYLEEVEVTKESDLNYPLPPNVFKMIEFMEVQEDYRKFVQWLSAGGRWLDVDWDDWLCESFFICTGKI